MYYGRDTKPLFTTPEDLARSKEIADDVVFCIEGSYHLYC